MALLSAVPFIYTDVKLTVVDALFESMSGITTTGATTLNNLQELSKGILIWRALLQWLGGIGIVIIALFILPFLRVGGMQLFHLEGNDPYDKFLPRISSVITKIALIYVFLTIILVFLYYINGMSFFDSVAHSFTTISTGGYSTHDESFGYFNNSNILIIAILFMIVGSLPFLVIAQTSLKSLFAIFKDNQIRVFFNHFDIFNYFNLYIRS